MNHYIAVDVGGTAIKYGVMQEDGRIVVKDQMRTEAWKGGPEILRKVEAIIAQYFEKYQPVGICISTAGMVDTEKGEIFYSAPLIPEYAGTKYKEVLEARFGIPCEVENDVNCAGLAEVTYGAAKGSSIALCLTIGTGIGGAILMDGKVFHGFSNSACEVGYMHMDESTFQTLGAASILSKKVSGKKGESPEIWSGYRIFEEAKAGDTICVQAIDEMVDVLGKGIANICYVINPQTVVLGGGVMAQEEYLKPRLENALSTYLVKSIRDKTTLAFAVHGNDAGMLGAFCHFKLKHKNG